MWIYLHKLLENFTNAYLGTILIRLQNGKAKFWTPRPICNLTNCKQDRRSKVASDKHQKLYVCRVIICICHDPYQGETSKRLASHTMKTVGVQFHVAFDRSQPKYVEQPLMNAYNTATGMLPYQYTFIL